MAKKRQIPFMSPPQKLADGTTVWHWKPSPRLRAAGFINVRLGTDYRAAVAAAIDLNEQLAAWQAAQAGDAGAARPRLRAPRVIRFAELVKSYLASPDFIGREVVEQRPVLRNGAIAGYRAESIRTGGLKPKTQQEYRSRLRQLERWAMDGTLAVKDIGVDQVRALRNELVEHASPYKAAALLRVLRLLLAFAENEGVIPKNSNPASRIDIPEPPRRQTRMDLPVREAITEAADALDPEGQLGMGFAIELGFWMLQRQGDLRNLNRFAWRELPDYDLDPRHAARLVDAQGRIQAFRLCQQKTGTWVDAPVPPMLHDRIVERLRRNPAGWLFPHPEDPSQPIPDYLFQRRFREAKDAAAAVAIMRGNVRLAEAIDACQFRDLRRTGMIAYKDAGASIDNITALSGHYVLGKKTIIDTYMPGDTAGAIACVAKGLRAWEERRQRHAETAV